MFNILTGGKHAQDSTDFQSSWSCRRHDSFATRWRAGAEVFAALRRSSTTTATPRQGDEGGFAPSLKSNEAAVEVILRAIEKAGYKPATRSASRSIPPQLRSRRGGPASRAGPASTARARGPDPRLGQLIDLWADWIAPVPDRLARGPASPRGTGRLEAAGRPAS